MQLSSLLDRFSEPETLKMAKLGRELRAKGVDVIDLSLGDSDLTTDLEIIEKTFTDIKNGHTHYANPYGLSELRVALCDSFAKDYHINYVVDECLVTTSGNHAIWLALHAIINKGDEILILEPYYPFYPQQVKAAGGTPVLVQLDSANGFHLDLEQINKKITATNLKQYGVKNPFQSKLIKDKIKAGYLEKHGVENPSQILAVKEKKKQTCLKNYGSEFPIQSKIIREKIEATCLKRYGTKNPIQSPVIREKIKLTNIKKYGHPHPAHTAKGRLTSFKKYGVSHPMQDYAVFKRCMKAAFKLKKYIAKDGVVLSYQGYEDVVLKFLLEELNIPSKDLIISKSSMPRIFYHSSTKNRKARYYPDIFIKASNLILEIKSRYTYNLNPLEAHEKQQASKAMGFNHMILICNKTNIIEIL